MHGKVPMRGAYPRIALKPKNMIPAPIAASPSSPPDSMQSVQRAVTQSLKINPKTLPVILMAFSIFVMAVFLSFYDIQGLSVQFVLFLEYRVTIFKSPKQDFDITEVKNS